MKDIIPSGMLLTVTKLTGLKRSMPSEMLHMKATGKWIKREYADLTEQWCTREGTHQDLYLELMAECSPGYRVVSRKSKPDNVKVKCPPVISGPHDTLEAGKAAYLMALATL